MLRAIERTRLTANHFGLVKTANYATAAPMTDPSKYKFNHSMLRVKDPKASVKFYEFLGMSLVEKKSFPDNKFDLYFLAYDGPQAVSHKNHWTDREGIIELTHNYGTENSDWKACNGNKDEGKGFGHVCVSVDNIQAACKRLSDAVYKFQKRLEDGRMRHIAFALDPDDYWVEIVSFNPVEQTANETATDPASYRMNHTMIRVQDKDVSLKFYQDVMGMNLKRTAENESAGFNLYFLGYGPVPPDSATAKGVNPTADKEGLLELTWNYGTEKQEGKVYHDGNAEPQGFGHICVSVDDLDAACKRFEDKGVQWKKRLTDGRMKNVAFVLDPDGYWIEVIQNEKFKPPPGAY